MADRLTRAELRTWVTLMGAMKSLIGALDRQLRDDYGISHDDYEILARLSRVPGAATRMTDLARGVGYSPSRVSHAIARFEREGWVERGSRGDDRRVVEVRLSDAGVGWVHRISVGHLALVRELVFEPLGREGARELAAAMRVVARAADERNSIGTPVSRR